MTITNSFYDNSAVIYTRYSSHNQREESIEAQIRECTEFAKIKGLLIIEIYSDSAKSGTNADREAFQRMFKDSEKNKFKYLIIHKLDRFSSQKYEAAMYKHQLKVNSVTILSVTENLDNSPESIMLESVIEGMV